MSEKGEIVINADIWKRIRKEITTDRKKTRRKGALGWLSWLSIQLLISTQVVVRGIKPHVILYAHSTEPALDFLSLHLSLSLFQSLSKKIVNIKKRKLEECSVMKANKVFNWKYTLKKTYNQDAYM